jgi:hypothetical protein
LKQLYAFTLHFETIKLEVSANGTFNTKLKSLWCRRLAGRSDFGLTGTDCGFRFSP